jgi:hypothetical protein
VPASSLHPIHWLIISVVLIMLLGLNGRLR